MENLTRHFFGDRLFRRGTPKERPPTSESPPEDEVPVSSKSGLGFTLSFLIHDKAALVGMVVIAAFLVWGIIEGIMQLLSVYLARPDLAWMLLPSNPIALNLGHELEPPSFSSLAAIFGTTYEGQSIFSQILYAIPHDALASVVVVASAIIIGMGVGIPAGYFGGWTDEILMRVTDAFLAFPFLILAIAFSVLLGNGFVTVLIALVIIWWPTYARYFRAQSITLKSRNFVEASKLSGVSRLRIMYRHIFPNSIDPVIAQATLDFGSVILLYSTLAFLGVGRDLNYPEWGTLSSDGLAYFPASWWYTLIPGIAIMAIVVAFSLIGDRLQDLIGGRITY